MERPQDADPSGAYGHHAENRRRRAITAMIAASAVAAVAIGGMLAIGHKSGARANKTPATHVEDEPSQRLARAYLNGVAIVGAHVTGRTMTDSNGERLGEIVVDFSDTDGNPAVQQPGKSALHYGRPQVELMPLDGGPSNIPVRSMDWADPHHETADLWLRLNEFKGPVTSEWPYLVDLPVTTGLPDGKTLHAYYNAGGLTVFVYEGSLKKVQVNGIPENVPPITVTSTSINPIFRSGN